MEPYKIKMYSPIRDTSDVEQFIKKSYPLLCHAKDLRLLKRIHLSPAGNFRFYGASAKDIFESTKKSMKTR